MVTPSLEGWPVNAKEALSPHEVRLPPLSLDTSHFLMSQGHMSWDFNVLWFCKYQFQELVILFQAKISTFFKPTRLRFRLALCIFWLVCLPRLSRNFLVRKIVRYIFSKLFLQCFKSFIKALQHLFPGWSSRHPWHFHFTFFYFF